MLRKQVSLQRIVCYTFTMACMAGIVTMTNPVRAVLQSITREPVSGDWLPNANSRIFRSLSLNRAGSKYSYGPSSFASSVNGPHDATSVAMTADWKVNTARYPLKLNSSVLFTDTSRNARNGWNLIFTFSGNQQAAQGWNGFYLQSSSQVMVINAAWNGMIPVNGSGNPGFNGSWSGRNPFSTGWKLDGITDNIAS